MSTLQQYDGERRSCRLFWCYECHRAIRIISFPATDVFCPRCFGRFLHEIDPPRQPPPRPFFFAPPPPPFFPQDYHGRRWVIQGPSSGPSGPTNPRHRRSPSAPPAPSLPPAFDPGNYFTGPNINTLIDELTQFDRTGPPPAPTSAIDSLPTVHITQAHLSDGSQCPVCKEEFELGEEARELPCKHVYHSDCIVPWLQLHNSCPVCRFELPGNGNGGGRSNTRETSGGRRETEPAVTPRWGPFSWLLPMREQEWEYHRYGSNGAGEDDFHGGAGGNDLPFLGYFLLVSACFLLLSFFV